MLNRGFSGYCGKILANGNAFYYFIKLDGEVTELAEGARLLSEWRPKTAPGFESLPLRQ